MVVTSSGDERHQDQEGASMAKATCIRQRPGTVTGCWFSCRTSPSWTICSGPGRSLSTEGLGFPSCRLKDAWTFGRLPCTRRLIRICETWRYWWLVRGSLLTSWGGRAHRYPSRRWSAAFCPWWRSTAETIGRQSTITRALRTAHVSVPDSPGAYQNHMEDPQGQVPQCAERSSVSRGLKVSS